MKQSNATRKKKQNPNVEGKVDKKAESTKAFPADKSPEAAGSPQADSDSKRPQSEFFFVNFHYNLVQR